MAGEFEGSGVVVTGGTRGIGAAVAEAFLTAGAEVLVCARSTPPHLPTAAGRTARFRQADLRDPDSANALVDDAVASMGRLDVLVNNAGGAPSADAATMSPRFAEKIVALNLLAPFYVAQAAHRIMDAADGGSIVNVGSVVGSNPQPGTAPYAAAKAGLLGLTRALALEWSPRVRVNHITTGLVGTDNAEDVYGPDGGASVAGVVPMGRLAAPEDVAQACLFLAGPRADYLAGTDLQVHGGGEIPSRYLAMQNVRRDAP